MVNYWAIAIGINQYELFQPLSCAQRDAEALKDFLVTQGGFLPDNCLLMTNTSPPIGDKSTYPTKENILLWQEELAAKSWQPQDQIWFFFSGYGVNFQDKDYLMPVEANPERIQETGIEVRSLLQSLQVTGLNVLLILDINRAFGTRADAYLGQEIIELASELQFALILSCQPEEFSHESSELGHGFFTAALLEILRSGSGSNLKDLASHISSLTPQLCQYYWRPIQSPVTIIPSRVQTILPSLAHDHPQPDPVIYPDENFALARSAPSIGNISTPSRDWWTETSLSQVEKSPELTESGTKGRVIPPPLKANTPRSPKYEANTPLWQQFLLWGGGSILVAGLVATFFLRHQASFRFKDLPTASPRNFPQNPPVNNSLPNLKPVPPTIPVPETRKVSPRLTQPKNLSKSITTGKIRPGDQKVEVSSQTTLDMATSRARQRKFKNAIATAESIPQQDPLYPQAQAAISQWRLEAKQYLSNKTLLDAARGLIVPGQASSYNRAIEVAKKVPPGQLGFDLAQTAINRWSKKILDLAKDRAAKGDFTTAIETAALVPEVTAAYEDAQDAIQKWQAKRVSH